MEKIYRLLIILMLFPQLGIGQVDSLEKPFVSSINPFLLEVQIFTRFSNEGISRSLGPALNIGQQWAISSNKTISLFTGIDLNFGVGLSTNLGGRMSYFYDETETYLQSTIKFSSGLNNLDQFAGYNFSVGQKYHKAGLGLVLSYDNYRTTDITNRHEKQIRLGLTFFDSNAKLGAIGFGIMLLPYIFYFALK